MYTTQEIDKDTMQGMRYDIAIVHNEERDTQSWILSETPASDDDIILLQKGHYDVLNMMIKEKPFIVFPVNELFGNVGRITYQTTFIHPKHINVPLTTFLANSQLFDIIEGDSFFEKLSNLEPLLDESNVIAQSMLMNLHLKHGLHCIGIKCLKNEEEIN